MCHARPRATPLARAPSCPPRRTIAAQLTPPDTASPPLSGQDIGQSAPKPAPEMASFDCLVFRDVEPRGAVAVPAHRKDLADPYPEPSQPLVRMGGPLGGRFKHIEDELYALRCVTRPGSEPSRPLEGQPGPPWRAVPRAPGRHARVRGALAPSGRPSRPPRSATPLPSPPPRRRARNEGLLRQGRADAEYRERLELRLFEAEESQAFLQGAAKDLEARLARATAEAEEARSDRGAEAARLARELGESQQRARDLEAALERHERAARRATHELRRATGEAPSTAARAAPAPAPRTATALDLELAVAEVASIVGALTGRCVELEALAADRARALQRAESQLSHAVRQKGHLFDQTVLLRREVAGLRQQDADRAAAPRTPPPAAPKARRSPATPPTAPHAARRPRARAPAGPEVAGRALRRANELRRAWRADGGPSGSPPTPPSLDCSLASSAGDGGGAEQFESSELLESTGPLESTELFESSELLELGAAEGGASSRGGSDGGGGVGGPAVAGTPPRGGRGAGRPAGGDGGPTVRVERHAVRGSAGEGVAGANPATPAAASAASSPKPPPAGRVAGSVLRAWPARPAASLAQRLDDLLSSDDEE